MIESIKYNLGNLFNFSGRQTRASFWPYVFMIIFLGMSAWIMVFIPELMGTMQRMQRFAAEHPELATVEQGPGHYSIQIEGYHPELMPNLQKLFPAMGIIVAVSVVLLAAAVSRRLHDRNMRGWIGLIPVIFLSIGLVMLPKIFDSFIAAVPDEMPDMSHFALLFLNNAIYLASLAFLVVQLCLEGTRGENRFGPEQIK